jgi:hypothetical protein
MTGTYSVPDNLLIDYGLTPGGAANRAYPCTDPAAVIVAVTGVWGPGIAPGRRGYSPIKLRPILQAIAAGTPLPPVPVYLDPADGRLILLDGAHRLGAAVACGYAEIPTHPVTREEAELRYGYPNGQR